MRIRLVHFFYTVAVIAAAVAVAGAPPLWG